LAREFLFSPQITDSAENTQTKKEKRGAGQRRTRKTNRERHEKPNTKNREAEEEKTKEQRRGEAEGLISIFFQNPSNERLTR
jgi:hypothetical protein